MKLLSLTRLNGVITYGNQICLSSLVISFLVKGRSGERSVHDLNACSEKTLPKMVGMVFLASKVQGHSLGIQT